MTGINAHRARHLRTSLPYDLIDSADRLLPERLAQQLSAGEGSEAIATQFVRCHGRATGAPIWRAWTPSLQKRRSAVTSVRPITATRSSSTSRAEIIQQIRRLSEVTRLGAILKAMINRTEQLKAFAT